MQSQSVQSDTQIQEINYFLKPTIYFYPEKDSDSFQIQQM